MSSDLQVVVVSWNGAELLPGCLDALAAQTLPCRVIVVDNGSTDASAGVVARYPNAEWLPLGRNAGFAAANNVGFRRALAGGARFVAIVNTDVELDPDWLERLSAAAGARPEAGIFGGLLLFGDDPTRVNSTGLELDWLGRARDRDFDVPLASLRRQDGPVAGVSGGAALLRADTLRRIGLFDPRYFAYYEDVDLSLRAARAGIGAWYCGAARARHGYGKSFGRGSPRQKYFLARNHMRAMATHLPLAWAGLVIPAATLLRAGVKAPLELLKGHRELARAHLRAAADGAAAAAEAIAERVGGRRVPPGADPERGPR